MQSPAELRELVKAIARGDRFAFDQLYRSQLPRVYSVIHRVLRDHAQAEECAAEVFVQVWKHGERYQPDRGEVLPWLLNMARSRAIDVLRRRRLEMDVLPGSADDLQGKADVDPMELLEHFTAGSQLKQAMGQLTHAQLKVILAAFFEGESASEIADRTAMPLGTVKSHLRRGMRKLQDCLATDAETLVGAFQ